MLRLKKNNALAIRQLAEKAKKKIPLYEENKADMVNVPIFDETMKKTRYLIFFRRHGHDWGFTEIVHTPVPNFYK